MCKSLAEKADAYRRLSQPRRFYNIAIQRVGR